MTTEEGIVTGKKKDTATVRVTRSAACQSCDKRESCGIGLLELDRQVEIEAENMVSAEIGDRVAVECSPGTIIKISVLLYLFPVLSMLIGALIGHLAARRYMLNTVTVPAASGFMALVLALCIARIIGKVLEKKRKYRPRIVSLLHQV